MKRILFFAVILLASSCANQQLNKGLSAYNDMAYHSAIDHLKRALEKDSTNAEARIALADAYRLTNDYKNAEEQYAQVVQMSESKPEHKMHYARMLMSANKHDEAGNMIRLYMRDRPDDPVAKTLLEACNYIEFFKEDTAAYRITPVPLMGNASMISPVRFGKGIAYAAEQSAGGKTNPWTGNSFYDIYYNHQENGEWQQQQKFGGKVSGQFHEGPVTFNEAEDYAIITRSNYKTGRKLATGDDNVSHFGLFESRLEEGQWTTPEAMPFNSKEYSVGHGSLSKDGNTLYFTSDMPGGFGGGDLYVSTRDGGTWSKPTNLGEIINTPGNEVFPNWHNDSLLYFSSDGQPSLGGLDIFKTVKEDNGWSKPSNMNFPINSTADDFSILFESGDTTGYLSSNRQGSDQIFTFIKVPPVFLLAGTTRNKETGETMSGISITLKNLTDGTQEILQTGSDGKFRFDLLPEKDYRIEGSKQGYFTKSHEFSTRGREHSEILDWEFELEEMLVGGDPPRFYTVDNIYYNYDDWQIRADAAKELDKLATLLKDNSQIVIELHSHTDSRASHAYNNDLSNKRAKAAVDYLISKGIPKSRLQHKGFGETQLLNHCKDDVECTEEEHAENRRTEFIIVSTTDNP